MRALGSFVGALVALVLPACSSSSSGGAADASADSTSNDSGKVIAAPDNCVKPGNKGNDRGVGAFCDDTQSCPSSDKTFLICTAYHGAPANEYFCTTPCSKDTDCGTGAYCDKSSQGNGCVPNVCGRNGDAGVDAGDGGTGDSGSGGDAADGGTD